MAKIDNRHSGRSRSTGQLLDVADNPLGPRDVEGTFRLAEYILHINNDNGRSLRLNIPLHFSFHMLIPL
ncbi:hypothetical protein D3C86_2146740 [compost metagenome]